MKKIVLLFVAVLCSLFASVKAQTVSYGFPESVSGRPGEVVPVTISMNNTLNISGWSLEVLLPEGVSFAKKSASSFKYEAFRAEEFAIKKVSATARERGYQISAALDDGVFFEGSEGPIVTFYLEVASDAALRTAELKFINMSIASEGNKSHRPADHTIPFKIYDLYSISAVSADETMGSVTLTNGGEAVENGTEVTAQATAVAGYSFVNWTSGETVVSTENPYKFSAAANTNLTANFKANNYDVTFDVDGQKTTSSLAFGSVIATPQSPVKTGYTFTGWEPAFEEGATVPVDGITYTAQWQINQYTITFDTDGGSEIASVTQDYNSAVTAPANPTKTGYTFMGWEPAIPETVPAENLTVKAQWQINQYTITFDTDGGSEIAPITQDYNIEVKAPADPTKTGYTFKGWEPAVPTTIPAENLTVKAQWQINQYTITFNTDGGSEVAPITQDYNTAVTAPADPAKTGYTFTGWDKEIPTTIPAEDVTITAQWQINQYTLTFNTDGGSEIAPVTQDYGTAVTVADPVREGYTFKGWEPALPETVPAENVTYIAQWQINQYTITFDTDGGVAMEPAKFDYHANVTVADPVREGYTFTGWNPALPEVMPANNIETQATWTINSYKVSFVSEGVTIKEENLEYGTEVDLTYTPDEREDYRFVGWDASELNDGKVPAKDVTITAQWKRNECTITFDSNGGSDVESQTLDCGVAITVPENPVREGYTFIGWEPAIPEVMPEEDITVVAQWQVNQYTITFDSNEGAEVESITLDYGSAITAPVPVREGYTFVGWDPELPATMPANDLNVTAQWQINQYTITFIAEGKILKQTVQDYNTEIVAPANPTKTGYTFAGWSPKFEKGATVPAEDVTYTAQWNVNTYFIYFNTDGGSSVDPIMQTYGSEITAPEDPVKEGYTFAGWDKEIPETMPANNMTIKAQWTINQYTITYYVDDVEVYAETVDFGTALTPYDYQAESGRVFDGWLEEIPATMPASDLAIHGTTSVVTAISKLVAEAGGKVDVYSLSGVLVAKDADMQKIGQLANGLYVIRGQKVVLKK